MRIEGIFLPLPFLEHLYLNTHSCRVISKLRLLPPNLPCPNFQGRRVMHVHILLLELTVEAPAQPLLNVGARKKANAKPTYASKKWRAKKAIAKSQLRKKIQAIFNLSDNDKDKEEWGFMRWTNQEMLHLILFCQELDKDFLKNTKKQGTICLCTPPFVLDSQWMSG